MAKSSTKSGGRKGWAHPTHQRVKDAARDRLGTKDRRITFRVSESEYAAFEAAMKAAGVRKVPVFLRHLMLTVSQPYLSATVQEQAVPAKGLEHYTAPAFSDDQGLDAWLDTQATKITEADLFGAAAPTVAPVAASAPVARPVSLPAVTPLPVPPNAPVGAGKPSVAGAKPSLAVLRELRAMMGDDRHVDADLRARLDQEGGGE